MQIIVRKPTEPEIQEAKTWPTWNKEVSSFPWSYSEQETCLILEGKVTIKTDDGGISFGSGDWVVFPQGLECEWVIGKDVRKHYKFGE